MRKLLFLKRHRTVTPDHARRSPKLTRSRDDPIADIAGYGYYAAREHGVPIMLEGQCGDELFWGYAPALTQPTSTSTPN